MIKRTETEKNRGKSNDETAGRQAAGERKTTVARRQVAEEQSAVGAP